MKKLIILLGVTIAATTACRKTDQPMADNNQAPIAACDLVTNDEIGAIQGTTINTASKSEGNIGPLLGTQCYYSSTEPNKSVTLGVIQKKPGQPGDPVEYWRDTFSEGDDEEDKKGGREKEEEKRIPPTKVTGIGDEAYWAGSAVGGTFYVLKKDKHVFLRISVGGGDSAEIKREKSKKIAEKALSRL